MEIVTNTENSNSTKMKSYLILNSLIKRKAENGFWDLNKDKEAVIEYQKEVDSLMIKFDNHIERFKYLIDNNYYVNFLDLYTENQIKRIIKKAYSYNFKFQSFMAISKFYSSYALKTNDGVNYLEYYEDRAVAVALYLAQGNFFKAYNKFLPALIEQRVQPATPTYKNSGIVRGGELVSCFLDEIGDSLNSINHELGQAGQLSKIGGGVALNGSKIRHSGEAIDEVENSAKGLVPVMKLFEDMASYADQKGQRPGAFAIYDIIFSSEIVKFIDTKKANADEKIRMKTLSTGVTVPSKFIKIAQANQELYLFKAYNIYKETGRHIDEIDWDKEYDELINNPKIKKVKSPLSARMLLSRIVQTQIESGYPFLYFSDNANRVHALDMLGSINMTNLCTEIMQFSTLSEITNYGEQDKIGFGISCNLNSLNIVNVMETKSIKESVKTATVMATEVSILSDIKNAPSIRKANKKLHSIGVGLMNVAGYFAKNNIFYGSKESFDFANVIGMLMNYYSLEASMELAVEHNESFYGFKKSKYYTGEYFDQYLEKEFSPRTKKVQSLFNGIYIPTKEDWKRLKSNIRRFGLFNAYRLAIAPTQSISYVQNSTQSIAPVTHLIEPRLYGDSTTYYPMPFLDPTTQYVYQNAYDLDQKKIIDFVAILQRHIDQGISLVLYADKNTPTDEIVGWLFYAHERGIKSTYYIRNRAKKDENQYCENCAI